MRRILTSVLLVLAGLGIAVPAGAAPASAPTVRFVSATLVAGGAAADLRYLVDCHSTGYFRLYQEARQSFGERPTFATGHLDLDCTGRPQDVTIRVAEGYGLGLRLGATQTTLLADFLLASGYHGIARENVSHTIRSGPPRNTYSAPGVPTVHLARGTVDRVTNTATVTVVTKCAPGSAKTDAAAFEVYQINGGVIAYGYATLSYACTGAPVVQQVNVTGTTDGSLLHAGPVVAMLHFSWCEPQPEGEPTCTDRYLTDTVRLV
ncbi:hypothetical protein KOI35_38595 [Actinoplanes bogorensis]|uniref:Uncharacterized protein n=1 Tax=Paractinoplanes bogorensis TaxID=1610840 RepID=A0ABS5Z3C0_9ACTN|nr:hypothetical protein [Actinoplanes bogorensis]MBU2669439.1 hypothetical protein [Actinoplanes bogorensis]